MATTRVRLHGHKRKNVAEQEVEKSNMKEPMAMARLASLGSRQRSVPQPAFRRKPSYRKSSHPTTIRSVGGTLRTLSATLHAVTLS